MERHQAGEFEDAHRLYREYLDLQPGDPEAWCLLGSLEGNRGRHADAGEAFGRAIEVAGGHAQAHIGLGTSLMMQGRASEAVQPIAAAVSLAPDHPELRLQLSLAQARSGRPDEAVRTLREVVSRWPDHLPGHYNLGVALLETDDPDAAARSFRLVVDRDAGNLPARIGLGRALAAANLPDRASQAFRDAIRMAPGDPVPKVLLGNLQRSLGRFDEAQAAFDQALEHKPGDLDALIGRAELERARGQAGRGLDLLRPLLTSASPPPRSLLAGARLMLAADDPEAAIERIETWLGQAGLATVTQAVLQSVRGQALDRLGRFDEAWDAWAASHRDEVTRFDGRHFSAAIDALRAVYTGELFAGQRRETVAMQPRPLLIVGSPRSGKSILEQMLACHPAVNGGGELRYLGAMTENVRRLTGGSQAYPACVRDLSQADLGELGAEYGSALQSIAGDAAWLIDTQPTNFLHIGLAALVAPAVRVVLCRRDPVDTAWACYGRRFADRGLAFASTPEGIGVYLDGMDRIMGHWRETVPMEILEIHYEELVRQPRDSVERVLGFMDLAWDEACADYAHPGRPTLRSAPVLREPVDDREIGRGVPYKHRFRLRPGTV
jgi:Flp pilus assembly protein TadD